MYDFSPFSVFEIQMHLTADWAEVVGHGLRPGNVGNWSKLLFLLFLQLNYVPS